MPQWRALSRLFIPTSGALSFPLYLRLCVPCPVPSSHFPFLYPNAFDGSLCLWVYLRGANQTTTITEKSFPPFPYRTLPHWIDPSAGRCVSAGRLLRTQSTRCCGPRMCQLQSFYSSPELDFGTEGALEKRLTPFVRDPVTSFLA